MPLVERFGAEVEFLQKEGLMQWEGPRFGMTAEGKKHFGGVVSLFYAPAVQVK